MAPTARTKSQAGKKPEPMSSRRDEILAVAASVVAERGIKGATVRDIGQAAGILSGSLYYHFVSKEQIVLELLLPSVQEQYERCVASRAAAASPREALAELIRSSVHETARHPNESVILRNEGRTFREHEVLAPIDQLRTKTLLLWHDVVKDGVASGDFRRDLEIEFVVRAMLDGVLGASRWFTAHASADRRRWPSR